LAVIFFALDTGAAEAAPVPVSEDEARSGVTEQEARLARRGSEEIERNMPIVADPALQARVDVIVNRLKPYMQRDLPYQAKIIDHEMINAFALAGGPIYVTTGMLGFVKTDLELAGVLAHEMTHADRKHIVTQMARNERMTLLAIAAAIAGRGKAAAVIAANALQVAVMGAYSIDIEKEADAYGIQALKKAGYNPVGMLTLQERLQEESLKRAYVDPGIYQTHPDTEERIAAAVRYMEDNGLRVERKYSLGVLRTRVESLSGDVFLDIDGRHVWRAPDGGAALEIFSKAADALQDALQLETAPYDIRVENLASERALFIESEKIVGEDESPEGAEPLETLREGIQQAIIAARREHPMADYFRR
jgi:hypothetical protein